MTEHAPNTVVIVGAGQAGFQVAASLREAGFAGAIRLLGDETFLPYQRPPLSKTYLKDQTAPDKTFLRPQRFFEEKAIEVSTGTRVAAIDRARRRVVLTSGEQIGWDRLVLATGVANRRLSMPGADLDGVVTLRGLDDAHAMRARIASAGRIVIVGGGVIGLEISALARGMEIDTVVVEAGDRLAGRMGSKVLSEHFLRYHRDIGSTIHLSSGLAGIEGCDGKVTAVSLRNGDRIATSLVLVSIGVVPNVDLAASAGLAVDDGIVVDPLMQTSDPAILAVGDCTRFKPPHGQLPMVRLESVQNAIDQGRCAADTIVGKPRAFDALPWFWSDQGTMKVQIAGLVAGHDTTIEKADAAQGTLSVFCFAGDSLICVECVNRPADFMAARRVLATRKRVTRSDVARADFDLKAFMK